MAFPKINSSEVSYFFKLKLDNRALTKATALYLGCDMNSMAVQTKTGHCDANYTSNNRT